MTGSDIPSSDPFALFDDWLTEAAAHEPNDPNAMALATATADGTPSVRMVLLKGHGPDMTPDGAPGGAFRFFTNAESRKGGEIGANPKAALLFHWKSLRRQVRIEGPLEEVSAADADAYFHSRSRASQIASAASDQSAPLAARQDYLDRIAELEARYPEGTTVPRPPRWTGFALSPRAIEFWQDRDARAHDRRRFTRDAPDAAWSSTLLYP